MQYHAPLFEFLAGNGDYDLNIFYTDGWDVFTLASLIIIQPKKENLFEIFTSCAFLFQKI